MAPNKEIRNTQLTIFGDPQKFIPWPYDVKVDALLFSLLNKIGQFTWIV